MCSKIMKLLGIAALVATAATVVSMMPDIKRYIKIESM